MCRLFSSLSYYVVKYWWKLWNEIFVFLKYFCIVFYNSCIVLRLEMLEINDYLNPVFNRNECVTGVDSFVTHPEILFHNQKSINLIVKNIAQDIIVLTCILHMRHFYLCVKHILWVCTSMQRLKWDTCVYWVLLSNENSPLN